MRRSGASLVALGVLLTCAGLARRSGLWLNLSPSMPIGLYRSVTNSSGVLAPGMIVAVCLPKELARWARARGYLKRGRCPDGTAPIGKPIFAVAGDTVGVTSTGLARNGAIAPNTRALERDRSGRPLRRVECGTYPVAFGQLWLVSSRTPSSWDSRYFGPIPAADVVAALRPIWVENGPERR